MFTKTYWKSSFEKLKSTKYLSLMAMFIALKVILGFFSIPIGANLNIRFVYIVSSLEAAIIGPGAAAVDAFATDLVSYFVNGGGVYFPGYMFSEAIGAMIYGLFFYKKDIRVWDILGAKFLVNLIVNVLFGSLWSSMLYGKAYLYYFSKSVIKNVLSLPIEVVLLCFVFKVMTPYLKQKGLLESNYISLFAKKEKSL